MDLFVLSKSRRVRINAVRVLRPLTYAGAGACMRNDVRRRTKMNAHCFFLIGMPTWRYTFCTKAREAYRMCDVLWRAWCMSLELCTSANQGSPGQEMNFCTIHRFSNGQSKAAWPRGSGRGRRVFGSSHAWGHYLTAGYSLSRGRAGATPLRGACVAAGTRCIPKSPYSCKSGMCFRSLADMQTHIQSYPAPNFLLALTVWRLRNIRHVDSSTTNAPRTLSRRSFVSSEIMTFSQSLAVRLR